MKESPQLLIFRGNLMPADCHEKRRVGMCLVVKQLLK
jgi:hypothetical protein